MAGLMVVVNAMQEQRPWASAHMLCLVLLREKGSNHNAVVGSLNHTASPVLVRLVPPSINMSKHLFNNLPEQRCYLTH